MKKLLILTLLFIPLTFMFAGDLHINEFIVTPTSSEQLEIYNSSGSSINLLAYDLIIGGSSWADTCSLPNSDIAAGGYFILNSGNVAWTSLPNEGARLVIVGASSTEDSVAYGSFGGAPAPIYNFSCARLSDTGNNALDFNIDVTPTMGTANDVIGNAFGTGDVYINEVFPDSVGGWDNQFIELKNFGGGPVDIANYIIYVDDDYTIPSPTIVDPNGLYFLPHSSFPQYFFLDESYDNVYLMNASGERVDQMGYSYYHPDTSYGVWGSGSRTVFDGYSYGTSTDFHMMTPTPNAANGIVNKLAINPNASIEISNTIFNDNITIFYALKNTSSVTVRVFDMTGKCVKVLVPNTTKAAGVYGVNWKTNGANGLYIVKATIGNESFAKKVVLNK